MAKKKSYNLILYELQQEAIKSAALTGNKKISNEQLEQQAQDEHLAPLKNASIIKRNSNTSSSTKSSVKVANVDQKSLKKATPNTFKRTWFKSGAFDDGYQIGDVTKTLLGTTTDLIQDTTAGIGGIVEKTIDAGAYLLGGGAKLLGQDKFAKSTQEFMKKDLIDEEKLASKVANNTTIGWANNLLNGNYEALNPFSKEASNSKAIESNSLLGEKTDSLIQSGGQLAATVGLQAVGVPWWITTGVTSFGAGTEEAFNEGATYGEAGFSALVSAGAEILTEKLSGGISFGGKTLDDALLKPLTEKITDKTLKKLVNIGVDAFGEGAEEVVSSVLSRVGKKLSYEDEKTWGEILASEEALDEYLEGFIGGAALGGGFSAINSIKNTDIAPTDNTAQIEGLQQAIESKQEEYNKSQDLREKQIIQDEIEGLNQELAAITNAQTITDENELRKQNFTYQAQETDSDIKKAVYESASQVMNNTQKSHKFVDVVAKIAEEKGTTYKFTNNEQLKQLGYSKDNVTVNGLVNENGEVLINIDSAKALNTVVGHETTHLLEGTNEYEALKQVAIEYAKSKGDYDARIENLTKLYEGTNADIEAELTSDIVGEYLFTDENFVRELSIKQPTVFEKIKNFISDLVVKFKGTDQEKQLRQLQRSFEKAYKAQGTQTNTDTKYSVSNNEINTYTTNLHDNQVDMVKEIKDGDKVVAKLEYSIYKNKPRIQMIEVQPSHRRKGLAKRLLQDLQNDYKDTPIDFGMTTPDGTKLLNSITYEVENKEYVKTQKQLGKVTNRINEIETNNVWDDSIDAEYYKLLNKQRELDKKLFDLEVDGNNKTDRFVKLDNSNTKYSLSQDNQGNELKPNVQKWAENSKARDENGNLKVLYHGTATGEFTVFDKSRASAEADWGKGFYLTDNENDVESNYEDGGPDFDNKISHLAERIQDEQDISYDEAEKIAEEQLYKGSYKITAYVNMENPAIVGETRLFDYEDYQDDINADLEAEAENYTDEIEERARDNYGLDESEDIEDYMLEEAWNEILEEYDIKREIEEKYIVDDIDSAIWAIEREYDIYGGTDAIRNLLYEAFYDGGIEIQELNNKLGALCLEAEDGIVGGDVARIIIESLGYDGIIDPTVSRKFQGMYLDEGTTHYIAFKENQIKSITNENPTAHKDINMSLSAQNEEIAPTGNWNVRGEDIKLQVEEAIAPLQETIQNLTEQIQTIQENIVPEAVQEVKPTRPTLEEVQNLMDIKENQSGSDYARAFFALRDKYGQPNLYKSLNEYNKTGTITEDTTEDYAAPISQEVVEKQGQEAFKNITDNEAPIFEDTSEDVEDTPTGHIESPLDSRDIDEVGNRKVKAYQYENPEVKPYFQQEAQAMLGDLDSTIKGVRTPVLDQDGYITGWYGLERQTTEAISYLKDKYGYSYEQIRKGLNAIIEDDGKENNAVSKRIEFMLDERLREGYTTSDGFPIPPNEEYINFLNENQITEYNKEAFNALTDADTPLEIAPEPRQSATINQNVQDEEYVPLKRVTAQKANTKLTDTNKLQQPTKRVTEPTIPEPVNDAKQLTLDGTEEDLVAKTKKQLRRELIEPNKEFFTNALDNAKNRSMAFMNNTDTIRNTELVFGREAGKVINEVIFQKEIDNEADSIAWQNKERQEIKELGIKARSKESAAVQKYGEKQYVNEEGKLVPYGDAELAKEFPNIDTQNKIKRAAQVIRNKYDNYIDEANEVLTKLGFDPIKKRKDYMRHFQELTDVFSRNGIPFNAKNMQEHVLPTDINGLTEFWSPQKNYFASMQARKGIKTNYDAITGIDGYIGGISNLIFHTEDIQRGRAFEELIRETYGESKGWENLEKLPDELKQARAEKIQDNHLSNYAAWVHEWTNNVAGKKNKLDRSVEATFGRKAFSFLDEVRKQVGSNMIGFNVSSSLTNLLAPVQAMSKTSKLAMAKGTADTIKNIFIKDNFVDNNKFLTSRFGTDMLSKNTWQKIQDAGYVFMKGVDWFSSNQIVRSKFYELRAKGLSEADAHAQAGQFAARIMGDRTKGAAPQLYNSKLVGLVTQFQLEVNNQLYSQFYDTYQESKENAKGNALKTAAGMTFTLGQIFAFTHLFGQTFESIAGYNPSFDIIEMIKTAFGWGDDEDEEKTTGERLKEAANQLVDALPYVNILSGGGRIPIASGIPNLVGVATGGTDDYGNELTLGDELKKLLLLLPPTGGNQVKKTYQGLSMYDEDLPIAGSYTDSGNLRYTVEDNIPSKLQAGIFGKWANENAQAYIDSDFKTIDKDNIEELVELGFDSNEYRKYKEGLNEIKRMEIEDGEARATYLFDYINSQDATEEQKSIMIKYLLSEEESEDISNLNMTTDETIDYYKAKSIITQEVAEYKNDKSLLTGDTESDEYKEAVSGLSDEKKSSIIDTIKNTNLSDEQKAYLYGKYYSSDKTLDKVINSGIPFDDYLTSSKDMLFIETTEDKAKYLYESDLTDEAKTVIYETSVLTGFDTDNKYKAYKTVKAAGVDINSWLSYKKQEFVADKDSDGKSISGSRKDKIISYVNSLDLNIPQKAMIIRTEYSTFDDCNNDIVSYVNDLDINYEEKIKILENLEFTIGEDGSVFWD